MLLQGPDSSQMETVCRVYEDIDQIDPSIDQELAFWFCRMALAKKNPWSSSTESVPKPWDSWKQDCGLTGQGLQVIKPKSCTVPATLS